MVGLSPDMLVVEITSADRQLISMGRVFVPLMWCTKLGRHILDRPYSSRVYEGSTTFDIDSMTMMLGRGRLLTLLKALLPRDAREESGVTTVRIIVSHGPVNCCRTARLQEERFLV